MSDFFQWHDDGSLSLDVECLEPDGSKVWRRVRIDQERLASVISDSPQGTRFLMNRVIRKVTPAFKNLNPKSVSKFLQAPDMLQKAMENPTTDSDQLLPPQILELESKYLPAQEIKAHYFALKV